LKEAKQAQDIAAT